MTKGLGSVDDSRVLIGLGLLSVENAWLLAIVFYFVSSFVVIFFNTTVLGCAKIRFDGEDPMVRQGLRQPQANPKIPTDLHG